MLKYITFSADERLIRKARDRARRGKTTLNALFLEWLKRYVGFDKQKVDFDSLMKSLSYANSGGVFTRDEMNES
ncbi:MAG TPA: hypothetical protein VGA95_09425 [Thermodesulfobacteriota bacterium]